MINFDQFFKILKSGKFYEAVEFIESDVDKYLHPGILTGHIPVLKNILKRAVQDAIGGHCNLKYWNHDVGNVINSLLRKIIAVFYVKENKYESIMFDNEPKLYQIPDPEAGAIRVNFEEILAELEQFRKTLRKLRDLRMGLILEIYLEDAVKSAIEEKVEAETISAYDLPKLRELEKWGQTMTNFIFEYNFDNILNGRKIEHFIHESYAVARGNDLFSMIRDYPDSEAAIKEFKECIAHMQTEKRFKIVQDLLKTIKLRKGLSL